MNLFRIRECRGPADAGPQYALWLRATADLPRAWRSSLRNVEHQLQQAKQYPMCRLYAEGAGSNLLGYIGTHPPFEWLAAEHGPPSSSLGWTIPFGYPWTEPYDAALETALYDEMIRVTPQIYTKFQRDIYIQRFRESWSRHLAFLEARGWRRHERVPLIGRQIGSVMKPPDELELVRREDVVLISMLSQQDDTATDALSAEDLQQRYDCGWIAGETFWRLGEQGAFALEARGRWAAVTVFYARPESWNETLQVAAAQASALGAGEYYFTVEAHEQPRRRALQAQGFQEVDAGIYMVRDAD